MNKNKIFTLCLLSLLTLGSCGEQVEENKKSFIIVPTEKAIQVCKDIFKVHKEQAKLLKEEIGEEKYQAFFSTIKQINTILNKREVE